jgi:hypothetical protein
VKKNPVIKYLGVPSFSIFFPYVPLDPWDIAIFLCPIPLEIQVVDEDGEKLAQEREEHRAVAELTRKEQDYVQALKEVSDWKRLSFRAALGGAWHGLA